MISHALLFVLWFLVWLFLSWPPCPTNIITGAAAALFVTFMTSHMPVEKPARVKSPISFLWLVYYIAVFIWECVKANIDVAWMVIHPDLPIRPGTVRVRTSLKSDIGLTFLANSITLTPGTTSVDIDKEKGLIYIHRLYVADENGAEASRIPIVERFEGILRKVFE